MIAHNSDHSYLDEHEKILVTSPVSSPEVRIMTIHPKTHTGHNSNLFLPG